MRAAKAALTSLLQAIDMTHDEDILQHTTGKQHQDILRDATVQRFEYTFEAVWKAAKQYLSDMEGIDQASPKGVVRSCREVGVLSPADAELALEMADDRNLTVHTYNEELAEDIYERNMETLRQLGHAGWLKWMAGKSDL
ncbi:MAG: nucleotidyltransferase substrate binding protein [Alicyclobacillus sp.]|nr:nucleotidyltransferase substrate binding protein [Alicyclobacillus sp.]